MTRIRCAVIEGSHCCKSASCLLQGYLLGDPIPMKPYDFELPSGCTLFKPVQTHVYYPKDKSSLLNKAARTELKSLSKKILEDKRFIVDDSWSQWMKNVLDDMNQHKDLQNALYNEQQEFFHEDVYHRNISHDSVRSNHIKQCLHDILTNAIFEYNPCKQLMLINNKKLPKREDWNENTNMMVSLKADPFSRVSDDAEIFFNVSYFSDALFFSL